MAVPVQTPYQEYTANGVATSFAVAFQCLSKETLIVTINGVEQSSILWNFTGGNVVFIAAPANLSIVGIMRSTALSREITYQSHDNSFRPDVLNGDIDRLWHVLQENQLIYNKKVDKAAQIQTLGNLQGGGAIESGLTLSLKDQSVTPGYAFGSSIKIPVITLNQDGTVKSLQEVDLIGGEGGAFQIGWGDVLNKPVTLAGYGITNAYTKTEANAAFIEDAKKGVASGVAPLDANVKIDPIYIESMDVLPYLPLAYPKSTPPVGYLALMGQAISQVTYPILYALYGATLPDLRGQFLRGLDYGRGIDVGRTVLSEQQDEIKAHTHSYLAGSAGYTIDGGSQTSSSTTPTGKTTSSTGGSETRVKNIAFLYIVKAG